MDKTELTTIRIEKRVKHFLDTQVVRKNETYNDILKRLLEKLGAKFDS